MAKERRVVTEEALRHEAHILRERVNKLVEDKSLLTSPAAAWGLLAIIGVLCLLLIKCNLLLQNNAAELLALRAALKEKGLEPGPPIYNTYSGSLQGGILFQCIAAIAATLLHIGSTIIRVTITSIIQLIFSVLLVPLLIYALIRKGSYRKDFIYLSAWSAEYTPFLIPLIKKLKLRQLFAVVSAYIVAALPEITEQAKQFISKWMTQQEAMPGTETNEDRSGINAEAHSQNAPEIETKQEFLLQKASEPEMTSELLQKTEENKVKSKVLRRNSVEKKTKEEVLLQRKVKKKTKEEAPSEKIRTSFMRRTKEEAPLEKSQKIRKKEKAPSEKTVAVKTKEEAPLQRIAEMETEAEVSQEPKKRTARSTNRYEGINFCAGFIQAEDDSDESSSVD